MGYIARLREKPEKVRQMHALGWTIIIFLGVLVLWFTHIKLPHVSELKPKDESTKSSFDNVIDSIKNIGSSIKSDK